MSAGASSTDVRSQERDRVQECATFLAGARRKVIVQVLQRVGLTEDVLRQLEEAIRAVAAESEKAGQEESILDRGVRLDLHGRTDAALDVIYDAFDALFREGRMETANRLLERADTADLSADLLVGILTATLPAKSQLPARNQFYQEVEQQLRERGLLEPGLLAGLEP